MFNKEKKPKRFMIKLEQTLGFNAVSILVDTTTGVNYLSTIGGGLSGITPLLDSEGKVIIDEEYIK